jgi:hypothetical protein
MTFLEKIEALYESEAATVANAAVLAAITPLQAQLDQAQADLASAKEAAVTAASDSASALAAQKESYEAQVASAAAQISTLTQQITALNAQIAELKAQIPASPVRPSGPGIIPFEGLPNAGSISATANQVAKGQQVSFLPGTFEFVDFAPNGYGCLFWVNVSGVRGSGVDKTVFRMKPNTSTAAGKVPAQGPPGGDLTNPLWLMRVGGAPNPPLAVQLSGFTLEGTPEGHLYNGLQLYWASGSALNDIKIKGIAGNNGANPGETFGIGTYHGSNLTFKHVEIDGTDSTGKVVAASHLGLNFSSEVTVEDSWFHHAAFGSGITAYQDTGSHVYTRVRSSDNRAGFNFEQCSNGTVTLNNVEISNTPLAHIIADSSLGSLKFVITDPILEGKPASATNKLRFTNHLDYWGKKQLQLRDATLIVNGVVHNEWIQYQNNNVGE